MPIYEYACRQCGHTFEYLVLHSTPPAKCPSCGNQDLEQLISLYSVDSASTRESHYGVERKRTAGIYKDFKHEDEKRRKNHTD